MGKVIYLTYPEPEIALIRMEDKEHRNTFSQDFILGIIEAFKEIENNPKVKVVITLGYDNYYACGGTLEQLKMLTTAKKTFDEFPFFKLPLECKLPTIAAVQGHAIGGGLAFACLHDFVFLGRGAIYSANFMNYGFTPGMGATYTLVKKFGEYCGKRLLFTAKQYSSKELESMKIPLPIYPREEVLNEAMALARDISNKTLVSVQLLKEQLSSELKSALPGVIKKELAMYAQTITSRESLQRVQERYGV